jgi:putative two-component system response regulator
VPQKILLVDDEFSFLEALALLLGQEGYEISTASSAEEALARLREKRPDLVITDFWMPRMSGLELCQRMHENEDWRPIPVLLMTAAHDSDIPRVPGLVGVVGKPLKYAVLYKAVKEILR